MNTITLLSNYHILIVKALPATNTKPARVKIISERFKQSIMTPFTNHPGASSPAIDSAIIYLEQHGYTLIGKGEGKDHMYIITSTFEALK